MRRNLADCLPEIVRVQCNDSNVAELFYLLGIEATGDWFQIAVLNLTGARTVLNNERAMSRVGSGGNLVWFNLWTSKILTQAAWLVKCRLPFLPVTERLSVLWVRTIHG